jgi:hypothetical protein
LRNAAIGRIDNHRRAHAGVLPGHEQLVVGAADVGLGPRSARWSLPASPARCTSNSARCAAVKNSWVAYLAGRCSGVSVSSVQIPWRSGSPQGVLSVEAAALAVASGA